MTKIKLDEDLIRKLSDLMDETGLTEIEITSDGQAVRVSKGHVAVADPAVAAAPGTAESPSPAVEGDDLANHPGAVTSPMVGTVYMGPEPGAPVFIHVGDHVVEGQTILIIEAMKTMNAVAATRSGTVKQIIVENEQPVEYGQPLVIIE
ncbi:MAG: acetyl-CoA carboxylase biotin carboxyl carrier protein [Alphaproteobacteria bacterium]|nr:MAG: acetyl-CoA carboxylase biotin carboxyl carrier protein [Alphaproteobacteria bacterium]